jgi:hypothetical protein
VSRVNGQEVRQGIRRTESSQASPEPTEVTQDTRQVLMPKCARVVERNKTMQNIHIEMYNRRRYGDSNHYWCVSKVMPIKQLLKTMISRPKYLHNNSVCMISNKTIFRIQHQRFDHKNYACMKPFRRGSNHNVNAFSTNHCTKEFDERQENIKPPLYQGLNRNH